MANVGDNIEAGNAQWSFAGGTVERFDEHVQRSIPLYNEGHDLAVAISDFFLADGSRCYDLGCSTGVLVEKLAEHHAPRRLKIIGIDCIDEMTEKATQRCQSSGVVEIRCQDLLDVDWEPADLIIAYYTMQFIKPKHRQTLFDRIYEALNWGGGFLLFEKVRGPDARFQDMMSTIYNDYKLQQGFSGNEIIAKTRSLKGVLEPFSTEGNLGLLQRAGFVDIMTVMKYVCFEGFLAIK